MFETHKIRFKRGLVFLIIGIVAVFISTVLGIKVIDILGSNIGMGLLLVVLWYIAFIYLMGFLVEFVQKKIK